MTGAVGSRTTRRTAHRRASGNVAAGRSRVSTVVGPQPGVSLSADGSTAIVQGGAAADANAMVRAADELTGPVAKLATSTVSVDLTGDSALLVRLQ